MDTPVIMGSFFLPSLSSLPDILLSLRRPLSGGLAGHLPITSPAKSPPPLPLSSSSFPWVSRGSVLRVSFSSFASARVSFHQSEKSYRSVLFFFSPLGFTLFSFDFVSRNGIFFSILIYFCICSYIFLFALIFSSFSNIFFPFCSRKCSSEISLESYIID